MASSEPNSRKSDNLNPAPRSGVALKRAKQLFAETAANRKKYSISISLDGNRAKLIAGFALMATDGDLGSDPHWLLQQIVTQLIDAGIVQDDRKSIRQLSDQVIAEAMDRLFKPKTSKKPQVVTSKAISGKPSDLNKSNEATTDHSPKT